MQSKIWLSLLGTALLASSCVSVTIPNTRKCAVKGLILNGANCAETNTGITSELTYEELVDFIQAVPAHPDPAHPGQTIPDKGAAIMISADDASREKTALEIACRALGKKCSFEMHQTIQTMNALLEKASKPE